jgi:hypothetical protein
MKLFVSISDFMLKTCPPSRRYNEARLSFDFHKGLLSLDPQVYAYRIEDFMNTSAMLLE